MKKLHCLAGIWLALGGSAVYAADHAALSRAQAEVQEDIQEAFKNKDVYELKRRAFHAYATENYAQGEDLFLKVLQIQKEKLDENDLEVAKALDDLAFLEYNYKKYSLSRDYYQQALDIRIRNRASPLKLAENYDMLAYASFPIPDLAATELYYSLSLEIKEKELKPNDLDLAVTCFKLGWPLHLAKKYEAAEAYFKRSMEISRKTEGPDGEWEGLILGYYALTLHELNRHQEAREAAARSEAIHQQVIKSRHKDNP